MNEPILPPLPEIEDKDCIPYEAIRYVAGFTREYVQRYAQEYARSAILADREMRQSEAEAVCGEAYQVVGSLLSDLDKFDTDKAEKILDNLSAGKLVHKDVLPWPSYELRAALDEPPGERVYKSVDELFDALGINDTPRATGCPDTMDDTARFAAEELPDILRKQAG